MITYKVGSVRRLTGTFRNQAGVLADPDVVKFSSKLELTGTPTILTYPADAGLVKDSTGVYHVDLPVQAGHTFARFYSTGNGQAAEEYTFYGETNF